MSLQDNLAVAGKLLREAKDLGADIACLPENFSFIGLKDADKVQVAEADGEWAPFRSSCATTARAIENVDSGWYHRHQGRFADAGGECVAVDRRAGQAGRALRQDSFVRRGHSGSRRALSRIQARHAGRSESVVADTPVGKLGLSVCYDMRFPELYRDLVSQQGPNGSPCRPPLRCRRDGRIGKTLLRARAIENLCYVVAPAQAGTHTSGRETYGDTLVVDYWGQVLSRLAKGTGVITADIDLAKQAKKRARGFRLWTIDAGDWA